MPEATPARRPGAPSKLTPEVQDGVCRMIRAGQRLEVAAAVAGVSDRSVRSWMAKGELAGATNARYRAFRLAARQAEVDAEAILVTRVSKAAAAGSWRAAAWLLERRFPERWAAGRWRDDDASSLPAASAAAQIRDELAQKRAARTSPGAS
jgi:transposase